MPDPTTPRVHPSYRPAVGGDDETRVPDVLPATLPDGTMIAWVHSGHENRMRAYGLRLRSDRLGYHVSRVDVLPGTDFCLAGPDPWFRPESVDWSSVAALRSQPAPVPTTESEFKVGDRLSGIPNYHAEDDEANREAFTFKSSDSSREGFYGYTDAGASLWFWTASIRRLPAQPATEGKDPFAAPQCKRCGVEEYGDYRIGEDGHCGHCTADLMSAARRDPYAEHRDHLRLAYGAIDDGRVATLTDLRPRRAKLAADTLRDLNRPLTPPRSYVCVGVMGDGAPVKRREVKGAPSTWPEGSDHE